MEQFWLFIESPFASLLWKAFSIIILPLFLLYFRRKLKQEERKMEQQDKMIGVISAVQQELAILGQAIKSVTEKVDDHDNRLWQLANGNTRNRRKP